jgi:hemerythrin-like metal-binding protein
MQEEFIDYPLQQTKVKAIRDRDHVQIRRMHRELRASIVQGTGMERVLRCSEELIQATLIHFESEERAMDEGPLVDQVAHQELHAELIETLEDIREGLEKRKICGAIELLKFFDERMARHLAIEESDFKAY